jgi:1,4-alpha-glucan branching enzyme
MLKKQVLKSKPVCKVTFSLSKKQVPEAQTVHLVGEFNEWSETDTEMTRMKNGDFKVTLPLETGKQYQFRYLVDGTTWMNDDSADGFVKSGLGEEENCIVSV